MRLSNFMINKILRYYIMNDNNYLEIISDINLEVERTPLHRRIEELKVSESSKTSLSDDLKKLMTVNNTIAPTTELNDVQLDMVLSTFKHIELTSRLYAMNPVNGKGISWAKDNDTDKIWSDASISNGYIELEDGTKKYYSDVTFAVIEKYTSWLVRTNSYSATLDQLDFSAGVTINKLVEDIVGLVAAGSPILQIVKKFSESGNEDGTKKGLNLSFEYKKENNTERLYQISPVGIYNQLLSFVATYFITEEQSKDFKSIFDMAFHHKSQMSAAGGMLLHYDTNTWGRYSQKIKDAMKKHEDSLMDDVFDLY